MSHTKPAPDAGTAYPFVPIPFFDLVGAKRDSVADGKARLSLELQPPLRNIRDAFHGGVLMTLLDVAMASAAVSRNASRHNVTTVNLSVNFMAPAHGVVVVEAEAVGGGKSLCFCEGRVLDAHGTLVARAHGTFKYLRGNTADSRHPGASTAEENLSAPSRG